MARLQLPCPLPPARCTCTSSSGAWPTSTPRGCVTVTSSPRTCWWTPTLLSSSSAILAGGPDLGCTEWLKGRWGDANPHLLFTPGPLFPQCKAVGAGGAQRLLHLLSLLPGPGADLRSHRLHLVHWSALRGWGGREWPAGGLPSFCGLSAALCDTSLTCVLLSSPHKLWRAVLVSARCTDEQSEAESGEATCLHSHCWGWARLGRAGL